MRKEIRPFDLNIDTLGFYINRVFYAMSKILGQKLKDSSLDIQFSEFTLLKALADLEEVTQIQLVEALGKERSAINRPLASLEQKGYVKREPLNGKTNLVTLTQKGEQVIPELNEIAEQVTEIAFKGFPQKSRISFINSLTRIYRNALPDDQ